LPPRSRDGGLAEAWRPFRTWAAVLIRAAATAFTGLVDALFLSLAAWCQGTPPAPPWSLSGYSARRAICKCTAAESSASIASMKVSYRSMGCRSECGGAVAAARAIGSPVAAA
jgi:hypothetical protein